MRIRPGMSCADILRNIRSARNKMTTNPNYYHVFGHMDDFLLDHQLSLEQKMNKICDLMAKDVINNWLNTRGTDFGKQLVSGENATVLVMGRKVTGDIADTVRCAKWLEDTRSFLVDEQKWSNEQLNQVDWRTLHKTLKNKPDGYRTWLADQHSGFCGTRKIVAHYYGSSEADVSCQNCGQIEKKLNIYMCALARTGQGCSMRMQKNWESGCFLMGESNLKLLTGCLSLSCTEGM